LSDGNVTNGGEYRALGTEELNSFLTDTNKFQLAQIFGKIRIYKVNLDTPVKNFTFVQNLPIVGSKDQWTNLDQAYADNGNYFQATSNTKDATSSNFYYPFNSLFTGRTPSELPFQIEERGEEIVFKKELPKELMNYRLVFPPSDNKELVWLDPNDLSQRKYFIPQVQMNNNVLEVSFPKVGGYFSAAIDPTGKIDSTNKTDSISFPLPNLDHGLSYLISTESKNVSGKTLLFWVENMNLRRADMEVYLSTDYGLQTTVDRFIQPPMESGALDMSCILIIFPSVEKRP